MRCNKCSGFVIYEPFFEFIGSRCMNCGKRFWAMPSTEITEFERFIIQQNNEAKTYIEPQRSQATNEIRQCKCCKKEFLCTRKHKKFCSNICRSNIRRKDVTQRKCRLCFVSFMAKYNNKIYCTSACLWKSSNDMKRLKRGN
jgi:hypothetical protein